MIEDFAGENRFLSNFYSAEVEYEGLTYKSVEHAYQAAKTQDPSERKKIREAETANKAKKLGGKLPKPEGWHNVSLGIMEDLVRQKFTKHPELKEKLLATGTEELVEGNWWGDEFWGVCKGKGLNHLGKILMKVRKELNDD